MKIRNSVAFLALFAVIGCTAPVSQPVIQPLPPVAVPKPAPIIAQPFSWMVLNREELRQLLANADRHPNDDFVIFALDTDNFKALNMDLQEMKRYIEEQKEALKFAVAVINGRSEASK